MSIKPLSKETIKLINSSQVITSVYSAVKELVENSLDAKAQNIEVNLVDNGLSLIQVKDNGIGISRDDAPFMALPSYTSKITDFDDLDLLSTYGFRGEGLTSICQVGDVTVSTKTEQDETMICHTLDHDGKVINSELSHGLIGTTVEIKDLFKKMPVRRNILINKKRINQEIKAVEILLKTYAICKPMVKFLYRVNGSIIFTKPSCKSVYEAVKLVLGIQYFSKLLHIQKNSLEMEFELFIPNKNIKSCEEVSQVGYQFLCVNDRPVKAKEIEKKINKRISEHFGQSNSKKFIFCLILKVDSKQLDVNLEPNKDKIFLHNETEILNEIDDLIMNFYELQDSQKSIQSDIENINCNLAGNTDLPVIKKRKIDYENSCNNDVSNNNILKDKKNSEFVEKTGEKINFLSDMSGPKLSDSESDDDHKSKTKKRLESFQYDSSKATKNDSIDSTIFDLPLQTEIIEETLSQLPKVDLGEDFNWEEIKTKKIDNLKATINDQDTSNVAWSKGQVQGLNGGVAVGIQNEQDSELFDFEKSIEPINSNDEVSETKNVSQLKEFDWKIDLKDSLKKTPSKTPSENKKRKKSLSLNNDPSQSRIPFAGDNACLSYMGLSAFSVYCAETRALIIEESPDLTPTEVAFELNKKWKNLPSEKRQYYRDLAKENDRLRETKSPMIIPSKKSKFLVSNAEKEKNRNQLAHLLENMKMKTNEIKADEKNKSMIVRSFITWDMNINLLTEKFNRPKLKTERSVVGSLNSLLWVVNFNSNLFVFDVTELHAKLNIVDCDINKINADYIKSVIDKWFEVKNDMNIFHLLHSVNKL